VAKRKARYTPPGGVLGVPRRVLRSPAYRDLTLPARCLMLELQDVWRPSEPDVHYSTRRAASALNAGMGTASRSFHELVEHGFIQRVAASDWLNGKARTYRLTWLSHDGREPTNDWMKWSVKLKKGFHHSNGQGVNRSTSVTVTPNHTKSPSKKQQVSDDFHPETVPPQIHH
jgi:hypothetical protein